MLLDWRVYTKLQSDLRRRAAADARPADRPPPHDLPSGGGRHRAPQLVRPQPAEHPHPHRAGAQHPPHVRRRRAGHVAPGGRLQPDRAARPGPCLGRCGTARRVRPPRRRPPRYGGPRAPQGSCGRHGGRAVDGQDGQLRDRLRHERLRPLVARQHPARGGAGVHQPLLRHLQRYQLLHAPHQGSGPPAGLRDDPPGPPSLHPRAPAAQPQPACRGRADGHQHAHPGHRGGHHEDRHDPAAGTAAARGVGRPPPAPGARRAGPGGAARRGRHAGPARPRDDGQRRCRSTCRSTWTSRWATTGSG